MPTILVVDDERNLVELITSYLTAEGFQVAHAFDGPAALEEVQRLQPAVIILDIMLPGLDGVEVCRRLRQFSNAYVLMLTARAEEVDKLIGLAVGADDYLTKPFSPRELVARVKALLRRAAHGPAAVEQSTPIRQLGELQLDEARHEVRKHGELIPLTAREFALLLALAEHPGRVWTRAQLLERIWGDTFFDDHVVDVHIGNLRKKLGDDPAAPHVVETIRGVGYRLPG